MAFELHLANIFKIPDLIVEVGGQLSGRRGLGVRPVELVEQSSSGEVRAPCFLELGLGIGLFGWFLFRTSELDGRRVSPCLNIQVF